MQLKHVRNSMLQVMNSDNAEHAGGFSMPLQSAKALMLNSGEFYTKI